jgi:hypothetical protein
MAYLQYRPTQTLFQYTTVDGVFGILRSKKLWLSDLRLANDPREIDLGFEKIIEALKSIAQSERRTAKAELLSHLIDRLTGYFQGVQVFCTCFSLAVDELPMWAALSAQPRGDVIHRSTLETGSALRGNGTDGFRLHTEARVALAEQPCDTVGTASVDRESERPRATVPTRDGIAALPRKSAPPADSVWPRTTC